MSSDITIYSDAELLDQIRDLANNDIPPTRNEFANHPETAGSTTLKRRFGSYNEAVRSAGLRPRVPGQSSVKGPNQLTEKQILYLRRNAEKIHPWPESEPFGMSRWVRDNTDYPTIHPPLGVKRKLLDINIIRVADRVGNSGDTIKVYETAVRGVPETLDSVIHDRYGSTPVPGCLHTGFRNLGDGVFTCCDDDCMNTCEKEDLRL